MTTRTYLLAFCIAACQACTGNETDTSRSKRAAPQKWTYSEPTEEPEAAPHTLVENMPEFPAGQKALEQCLTAVRPHGEASGAAKIPVSFVIERDGSVSGAQCALDDEEAMHKEELCAEAVRKVSLLPKWRPGRHQGQVVRVQFTVFVKFID